MFKDITWSNYLMVIGIGAALYYAFIALKYYPTELKRLFKGRKTSQDPFFMETEHDEVPPYEERQQEENNALAAANSEMDEVDDLTVRIKELVANAGDDPKEFRQYLSMLFQEYPTLKSSSLREAVNEFVTTELKNKNTVLLSEKEVDGLW